MRKHRTAPTNDEIRHAIDRAKAGKGRQLAAIVKSFSEDDLSYGFMAVGKYGATCFSINPWGALGSALAFASGRKEQRGDLNKRSRDARNRAVREWKAQRKLETEGAGE